MQLLKQTYDLQGIEAAAAHLWRAVKDYRIMTLTGDLGAGKTTLVSALGTYLHIEDAVSSPTFALVNEYTLHQNGHAEPLYHIDWYRLRNEKEAFAAGMEEYIEDAMRGRCRCIIEWPDKAAALLQKPYVAVTICTNEDNTRTMTATLVEKEG